MDRSTGATYGTVALILAVTLLSGPVAGVLDLTTPRVDASGAGEGTASIDEVDAPTTATFDRGYRSESYYLKVPDARVHVAEVTGRPLLAYRLDVHAMNYSRTTTHFLEPGDDGWIALSISRDTFAGDGVTREGYEGSLSIAVRGSGEETVVYSEEIAIEVAE